MIGLFAGDVAGSIYRGIRHSAGIQTPLVVEGAHLSIASRVVMGTVDGYFADIKDSSQFIHAWVNGLPPNQWGGDIFHTATNLAAVIAVTFSTLCRRETDAKMRTGSTCEALFPSEIAGDAAVLAGLFHRLKLSKDPGRIVADISDALAWALPIDLEVASCDATPSWSWQDTVPLATYIGLISNSVESAVRLAIWSSGDPSTTAAIAAQVASLHLGTESLPSDLRRATLACFDDLGGDGIDMRRRLIASDVLDLDG